MNKVVGSLLLLGLLILPAALVVGFSYAGTSYPIEDSIIEYDSFLRESTHDIEILFFGYAGCATVCPVSLAKLASVLNSEQLKSEKTTIGGLFVDVKAVSGSAQNSISVDHFSRSFSPRIRGYSPDLAAYQQLANEFIIRLYESRGDGGVISHTDHFFVLVRNENQWTIDRVVNNHIDESDMINIISQSINNL